MPDGGGGGGGRGRSPAGLMVWPMWDCGQKILRATNHAKVSSLVISFRFPTTSASGPLSTFTGLQHHYTIPAKFTGLSASRLSEPQEPPDISHTNTLLVDSDWWRVRVSSQHLSPYRDYSSTIDIFPY